MSIKPTINYPTSLDSATTYNGTDQVSAIDHAGMHTGLEQAVVALETKVGIDSSAVDSTHDFKLSSIADGDKAVSTDGNQTIAGDKTFSGSTKTTGTLEVNGAIKPSASNTQTIPDATSTLVDIDSAQEITNKTFNPADGSNTFDGDKVEISWTATNYTPTDVAETDDAGQLSAHLKGIDDEINTINLAIAGVSVVPQTIGLSVSTAASPIMYSDIVAGFGFSGYDININVPGSFPEDRTFTSDWADADSNSIRGAVIIGTYLYVMYEDNATTPDTFRVYRYDKNDLASGGTLMTFAGATTLATTDSVMYMTSDGTDFYFNYEAGNSANDYVLAKYTLSGTTLTYDSSITCGSTGGRFDQFFVTSDGNIYALDGTTSVDGIYKYNSSGTLQLSQTNVTIIGRNVLNYDDNIYIFNSSSGVYELINIV